jgi:hypothetical protein
METCKTCEYFEYLELGVKIGVCTEEYSEYHRQILHEDHYECRNYEPKEQ